MVRMRSEDETHSPCFFRGLSWSRLMSTMLNDAAAMDDALQLIAGNETCPRPQTSEHLTVVKIMQPESIIILQNKVDLIRLLSTKNQSLHSSRV
ncbi:hypothetical protein C8R48DRAFT_799341, partial [Suillus tomentosus]